MSITTFRMKLGDWISGGRWSRWNDDLIRMNDRENSEHGEALFRITDLRISLHQIIALETPKAAHSVKKAARIARGALDKDRERL